MANLDDPGSMASNALGTLLGYVGAEAATPVIFERLLWPQRAYARLRSQDIILMALLSPAGGPLYKACIETLDGSSNNGLFRGKSEGQMLGTSFFPNYEGCCEFEVEQAEVVEDARNNIWPRIMTLIPLLALPECKESMSCPLKQPPRARIGVHQLTLKVIDSKKRLRSSPCASTTAETGFPSYRVFCAIAITEISALIIAAVVGTVWQSYFAFLWLCPFALKLLSAINALNRDGLILKSEFKEEPRQKFHCKMPAKYGRFLIIEGAPSLVTRFFRHYGHPERDRFREKVQIATIVLFGLLFPVGLLSSIIWMPNCIQYTWVSHQVYLVCAMYIARYARIDLRTSMEQSIADALRHDEELSLGGVMLWQNKEGLAVQANINTTYANRYGAGRKIVEGLLKPAEGVKELKS